MRSKNPWFKEGLRFGCNQCGICCRGRPGAVWVTEKEIIEISDHLKMPVDKFGKEFLRRILRRYSLIEFENGDCVMYENGCRIYSVRPYQCRSFPFWRCNLETKVDWHSLKDFCQGIDNGKLFSCKEIVNIVSNREDYKEINII